MSRMKLWVGLVVLFGAGVATGVVGAHVFHDLARAAQPPRGAAAQHERIMKRLTEQLSLSPAQQAEAEPIVTRAHVAVLELRLAQQAEVDRILAQSITDLKSTLSSTQQAQLDELYRRLQGRWQASRQHLDEMRKRLTPPASVPAPGG